MARRDKEWVADILSAIADIRADTAGMDFAAFAADPSTVRAVLYSISVIGEAAKNVSPAPILGFLGGQLPETATGSSTSTSAPTCGESGTWSRKISTRSRRH
jgi:Protein of unknown function DUF86